MKAFKKIMAVAAVTVGALALAGCSSAQPSYKTVTGATWNTRTSAAVERDFAERWLGMKEVAQYKISMTKGNNGTYSVSYNDGGTYSTEFGMTYFDWTSISSLPDGYAPEKQEDSRHLAYFYKTTLSVTGQYALDKGDDKYEFEDSVTTICYFRTAGDNLQPLYSRQDIKNVAPNTLNAPILAAAYVKIDSVYETFYNYSCTEATVVHTNNLLTEDKTSTQKVSLTSDPDYSVFDNSQLRVAVRSFTLSGNHTFNVLTPQNGAMQEVIAACASPVELNAEDEEQKGMIDALDKCSAENPDYIFFDKGEGENAKNYRYTAVDLGINVNTPMSGPSVKYWYATVENAEINTTKSVLLKMSTPLSFGLGTINYTLSSLSLQPNDLNN